MHLARKWFAPFTLSLFACLSAGCSSDPAENFCSRVEALDCVPAEGGSCRGSQAKSVAEAEEAECGDEYADYLDCWASAIEATKSCSVGSSDDICPDEAYSYVLCRSMR